VGPQPLQGFRIYGDAVFSQNNGLLRVFRHSPRGFFFVPPMVWAKKDQTLFPTSEMTICRLKERGLTRRRLSPGGGGVTMNSLRTCSLLLRFLPPPSPPQGQSDSHIWEKGRNAAAANKQAVNVKTWARNGPPKVGVARTISFAFSDCTTNTN
jgi:hypothetical protein